jgi:hypothetical protein
MDRRRFILATAAGGAGLATAGLTGSASPAAATPTDEELAYANFGLAVEFLLGDFYGRTTAASLFGGATHRNLARARLNAHEHAASLSRLLADAGQDPAVEEDFAFAWPAKTFDSKKSAATAGLRITQNLLGVYQTAAASIAIDSYRALYASMTANVAQQAAVLSEALGRRTTGISFPAARDLESATTALEGLLG